MGNDIKNYFKNNLLFQEVDIDELDFSSVTGELVFKKSGEYIVKDDLLADKFFLIIEGAVITTEEGKKHFLSENHFFGKEAAKGEPIYNFIAVADKQTLLLALSSDEAAALIAQNPKLAENLEKEFDEVIPKDDEKENIAEEILSDFPEHEEKEKIIETKFDSIKAAEIITSVFESPTHFSAELINDIINETEDENLKAKLSAVGERIDLLEKGVKNAGIYLKLPTQYQTDKKDLKELLTDFADRMKEEIDCKIPVEGETDLTVELDAGSFYEALEQIVINSCEAMEEHKAISINLKKNDGLAEILIADSGSGIPPEFTSKIFEPYFTSGKENHIGLGLAIADKIISANNGKMAVKKTDTQGSVISIILPIVG